MAITMLEKKIEVAVKDYARSLGCLAYKFTSPGHSFVPDGLFIAPNGLMWFCEFKREGAKPTPGQLREHERLREHGVMVFVVDSVAMGKRMVDSMVEQDANP